MVLEKLKFNLSASSYKMYNDSQLQFFYTQIIKSQSDTNTVQCYGAAGNVVHNMLEEYIKGNIWDVDLQFRQMWDGRKLPELLGINNQPLDMELYKTAVQRGIHKLKYEYTNAKRTEELFEFPLIDNDRAKINFKGFIDVQHQVGKNVEIIDWKTSSNVEEGAFDIQSKFYYLLFYKKYGYLPKRIVFEYLKIDKTREYTFTIEEIKQFEQELKHVANDIVYNKGWDIENYDLGNYNNIFNNHLQKCETEKQRREGIHTIEAEIKNNRMWFRGELPKRLKTILNLKYKYKQEGAEWSQLYQMGKWDGYKRFFKKNSLPYGFIHDFSRLLDDYNKKYNTQYKFRLIDERDKQVINGVYPTKFQSTERQLRNYQSNAVQTMLEKEVGIMYMGTGLGKTFTTIELMKNINRRTLFIVNRLELVEQAHTDIENTLGVKCGKMSEGNLDVDKQFTVAAVQTIDAICKRNDSSKKQLLLYLYNVSCCIWDECHGVGDSKYYNTVMKHLVNIKYMIGLTGSPFRNGGDTLEMNAVVGFPEVEYSTEWGEKEGWLCPTETYFIQHKQNIKTIIDDDFHSLYNALIVNNDKRNNNIVEICKTYNNKKILVLTKIKQHGHKLLEEIPGSILINSDVDIKTRKENMKKFKSGQVNIMIAGIKIMSLGIDIPDLDIVINASAHKSINDSVQIIGRVKRKIQGKEKGYYIDFFDDNYFKNASNKRMKILKEFGNKIEKVKDLKELKQKI